MYYGMKVKVYETNNTSCLGFAVVYGADNTGIALLLGQNEIKLIYARTDTQKTAEELKQILEEKYAVTEEAGL